MSKRTKKQENTYQSFAAKKNFNRIIKIAEDVYVRLAKEAAEEGRLISRQADIYLRKSLNL